jgi:hypothetical protein
VEFQQGQSYVGAPFPEVEWGERTALLSLGPSGYIAFNEVVCRDDSQLSGDQSWQSPSGTPTSPSSVAPSGYVPQPDMVVPAKNANAGLVYGVLKYYPQNQPGYTPANQAVTSTNLQCFVDGGAAGAPQAAGIVNSSSTTQTYLVNVRWMGYTPNVWCKVGSATAITIGSNLVANPGSGGTSDAAPGAFTGNKNLGFALASLSGGNNLLTSALVTTAGTNVLNTAASTNVYGLINVDLRLV